MVVLFAIEAKERQVEAGRLHGAGQQVSQIIDQPKPNVEAGRLHGAGQQVPQIIAEANAPQSRDRAGELLGVNQFVANRGSLRVR